MSTRRTPDPNIEALVVRLFCGDEAPYGAYVGVSDGEVLIAGILFRFTLEAGDHEVFTLQLYYGINTLGGALWTREVRALLRASSQQHPALPGILSGAYVEEEDLAFVITRAAMNRLSEAGQMKSVNQNRVEALRQLTILAQGLSLLHEQGIVHRNLHPGSVECILDPNRSGRYTLRLCRFEMSAMVSNLVRRKLAGESLDGDVLRRLYLGAEEVDEALPYCPPERAAWLFDGTVQPENDRSDVFALGVFAWHWLVEPPGDRATWLAREATRDGVLRLHQHMRASLEQPGIPQDLAMMLRRMLAVDPRDRPSIFEVVELLARHYGAFASSFATQPEDGTYYVGFMPMESKKTIYRWGWIREDPSTLTGSEQLRAFLEQELERASLMYVPEGFSGYREPANNHEREALKQAKYVLVGKQAYWFCEKYIDRFGRDPRPVEQLLIIKYVVSIHRAWRLAGTPLRRPVPGHLKLVPAWVDRRLATDKIRGKGTIWEPLLKSVEHDHRVQPWVTDMDDAMQFLLAYRRAALDAQTFPYQILAPTEAEPAGTITIVHDLKRDREYQFADALRSHYFDELRIPMGRLFDSLDAERTASFALYADEDGRPNFGKGFDVKLTFVERLDDNTVRLDARYSRSGIPERGWIRPTEDFGSHLQQRRQEAAVHELLRSPALLEQLHNPVAIRGIRTRWAHVGQHLEPPGREIVKDMLSCEPFYALHGPPGSGKTTVAAVAVAEHLKADPSQRILISSQSHFALDNLGVRIIEHCMDVEAKRRKAGARGEDPLGGVVAVRIASDHAVAGEKIHPSMARRLPDALARAAVDDIQKECARILAAGSIEPAVHVDDQVVRGRQLALALRDVLVEWKELAPRVELELRDRIRRGANLVFATTGACTDRQVSAAGVGGMYDWVIVEEAARAWPSELAQPLVRGLRWTLIGDHFQLPAFDDLSVQRFLELCLRSDSEELRGHGEKAEKYRAVFRMFASLFENRALRRKGRPKNFRLIEPVDELDVQFRMHTDICKLVSKAFYRERTDPKDGTVQTFIDGWLTTPKTLERSHDVHAPARLRGSAVVWLDTAGVTDSVDQRAWWNPGEAEVIRRLLERLRPTPPAGDEAFAVLTPYHAQRELLEAAELPDWVRSRIYTIDSFQGREADIVVVSLVRSVQRAVDRPESNIGYLVSPNRVNVLLSRARKLLIIVGRLEHFEQQARLNVRRTDLRFWQTVGDEIRAQQAVVSAVDMLGKDGAW